MKKKLPWASSRDDLSFVIRLSERIVTRCELIMSSCLSRATSLSTSGFFRRVGLSIVCLFRFSPVVSVSSVSLLLHVFFVSVCSVFLPLRLSVSCLSVLSLSCCVRLSDVCLFRLSPALFFCLVSFCLVSVRFVSVLRGPFLFHFLVSLYHTTVGQINQEPTHPFARSLVWSLPSS